MKNLKLKMKILGCFAVTFVVMVIMVLMMVKQLNVITENADKVPLSDLPSLYYVSHIRIGSCDNYANLLELIAADKGAQPQFIHKIEETSKDISSYYKNYEGLTIENADKELYKQIHDNRSRWTAVRTEVIDLVKAEKKEDARSVLQSKGIAVLENYHDSLKKLEDQIKKRGETHDAMTDEELNTGKWSLWIGAAIIFGMSLGSALLINNRITEPVNMLVKHTVAISHGDLKSRCSYESRDEIGVLSASLNKMSSVLHDNMSEISQNANMLALAAEELSSTAEQMVSNSENTTNQAGSVFKSSGQVAKNMKIVATSTEEMSASIREISKNSNAAATVAVNAVKIAETTTRTITQLGQSSTEIGEVVKVITAIAQQTNLLALNATIEAARAGDAGKGFAVVANEVKALAEGTSKATETICRRIDAIQNDTSRAVKAIDEISGVIAKINEISSTIASAVEEQSVTMNEIGRNVGEAATCVVDINQNMTSFVKNTQETSAGAGVTQRSAASLAEMAAVLKTMVAQFQFESNTPKQRISTSIEPKHIPIPNLTEPRNTLRLKGFNGTSNGRQLRDLHVHN